MSKTNIVNYTQIPNLRAIKNRDMKSPVGERNKYNIGLGHPSFIIDELPANSISKSGDVAYIEDLDGMGYYSELQGGWSLIGAEPALTPSFRGFELSDGDEFLYPAATVSSLVMGDITARPGIGVLDTHEDGQLKGIINNSPDASLIVLITANVTLATLNNEGTNATVGFLINSVLGEFIGNPTEILLITNDKFFTGSITTILTLQPGDYASLFLAPSAQATIQTQAVNMTALQLSSTLLV